MKIEYLRNVETKVAHEAVLDYIYGFYPIEEATFIPFIKDEFRTDEILEDHGYFYDLFLQAILDSLDIRNYIGTSRHTDDIYSDYYESDDEFINVLFTIDDRICYVEAIFYTPKLDDEM